MRARNLAAALALAASVGVNTPAQGSGLDAEFDQMFDNLGAMGNITAPGAFRGQTYNTYTGGSFYMRAPNRTYSLANMAWPTARGGCGGIDLFGGSFSHLSADEFKQMLQNITSALPGIAFQLAVETVSPLLGSITKWAKSFESMLTNARKGSCELATSMVSSGANAMGFDSARACASLATQLGLASDHEAAVNMCRSQAPSILDSARTNTDPNIRAQVPFTGNLVWAALKRAPALDDETRQIVMSITGTTIYYPQSAGQAPLPVPPSVTTVRDLLYGAGSASTLGNIRIKLLRCDETVNCLTVTPVEVEHQGLVHRVETLMRNISDAIRHRRQLDGGYAAEIGFVNTTSLPVWRILSIGNSNPNSAIAEVLISNYREVIAADYAFMFLSQFANVGLAGMLTNYELRERQAEDAAEIRDQVREFLTAIRAERASLESKLNSLSSVASDLERLERNLRSSLAPHLLDMLGHSYPVLR